MKTGFDNPYYYVVLPSKLLRYEILLWCFNVFGHSTKRWYARDGFYFFRNQDDLYWFMLRWSS